MYEVPKKAQGNEIHGENEQRTESGAVSETRHTEHGKGTQERSQQAENQHKVTEARSGHEVIIRTAREPATEGHVTDNDGNQTNTGVNRDGLHYSSSFSGTLFPMSTVFN